MGFGWSLLFAYLLLCITHWRLLGTIYKVWGWVAITNYPYLSMGAGTDVYGLASSIWLFCKYPGAELVAGAYVLFV